MSGIIEAIYVTPIGGDAMQKVDEIKALVGQGLAGDRYAERTGYWTGVDECQVTLIEAEDLEAIHRETGLRVLEGQHRRNLVVRNLRLDKLRGQGGFRIGSTVLKYDRPRPPCAYIQSITEPGMTKALLHCGGICARVVESGVIRIGDAVEPLA